MTLAAATPVNTYIGTGAFSSYLFTFPVFIQSHLFVTITSPDGLTNHTLALGTDFIVYGLSAAGSPATTGGISLVSSGQAWLTGGNLTTGWILVISRQVPIAQNTSIRNQGDFYPESHEDALDYQAMIAQQLQAEIASAAPTTNLSLLPRAFLQPLSGTVDGVNAVFTAPQAFINGTEEVFIGGVAQNRQADYTVTGHNQITFTSPPPVLTAPLLISYSTVSLFAIPTLPINGQPNQLLGNDGNGNLAWMNTPFIDVSTFGAKGDGITDDAPAIRSAIAFAALAATKAATIVFPYGTYLCNSPIVNATTLTEGLRFLAYGLLGGTDVTNEGTIIKYTGAAICWDLRMPTGTSHEFGKWTWEGFNFQCTNDAGGMFQFNDASVDPTLTLLTSAPIREVTFINCTFFGSQNSPTSAGRAIQGAKVFELVVDENCYFVGWGRAIYLNGCDNCTIAGRFVGNVRHIQTHGVNTYGNELLITARFFGELIAGTESSYLLYLESMGTVIAPLFETDTGGCVYMNAAQILLISPRYSIAGTTPPFELGPNAIECRIEFPRFHGAGTHVPVISSPASWDWGVGNQRYGVTIFNPDAGFMSGLLPHPMIRVVNDPEGSPDNTFFQSPNYNITSTGPKQRKFVIHPFNYFGQSNGAGLIVPIGIASDAAGYGGYAIQLANVNTCGFQNYWIVGRHMNNADTVKVTIWYKMLGSLSVGRYDVTILNNAFTPVLTVALNASTSYVRQSLSYTLSGFTNGNQIFLHVANNGCDVGLNVAMILVEVVDPVMADTSGAILSALETEVNKLKALFRKYGYLAE